MNTFEMKNKFNTSQKVLAPIKKLATSCHERAHARAPVMRLVMIVSLSLFLGLLAYVMNSSRFLQTSMGYFLLFDALLRLFSWRSSARFFSLHDAFARRHPIVGYIYPFVLLMLGSALLYNLYAFVTVVLLLLVASEVFISLLVTFFFNRNLEGSVLQGFGGFGKRVSLLLILIESMGSLIVGVQMFLGLFSS